MTSRLIAQIKAASSRAIRRDDDGRPLALPGGRAKAPAQPHLRFPSNLAHRTRCGGHLHLLLAANAWRIPIAPENSCRATSISFTTPRAVFAGKAARDTKRSSFPINPVHALSHWSQYCNLIRMDVEQIRNLANLGLSSMHESAMDKFRVFVDAYLRPQAGASLEVLDVGSRAVGNGSPTHRAAIVAHGWRYVGLDIEAGENVDLQVSDGYDWKMVEDDSFDVVLCSQVLEHTRYPWRLTQEMARVLRPARAGIPNIAEHRTCAPLPGGLLPLLSRWVERACGRLGPPGCRSAHPAPASLSEQSVARRAADCTKTYPYA
jgi:SAM-dependent methyltransferase